jgi:hypothetical protein
MNTVRKSQDISVCDSGMVVSHHFKVEFGNEMSFQVWFGYWLNGDRPNSDEDGVFLGHDEKCTILLKCYKPYREFNPMLVHSILLAFFAQFKISDLSLIVHVELRPFEETKLTNFITVENYNSIHPSHLKNLQLTNFDSQLKCQMDEFVKFGFKHVMTEGVFEKTGSDEIRDVPIAGWVTMSIRIGDFLTMSQIAFISERIQTYSFNGKELELIAKWDDAYRKILNLFCTK